MSSCRKAKCFLVFVRYKSYSPDVPPTDTSGPASVLNAMDETQKTAKYIQKTKPKPTTLSNQNASRKKKLMYECNQDATVLSLHMERLPPPNTVL